MKTLAPFLYNLLLPGLGQISVGKSWRGILILVLTTGLCLVHPFLFTAAVLLSLADLYYIEEKKHGRKAASRRLTFSLIVAFILIPGLLFLLTYSTFFTMIFATDHLMNPIHTESEMGEIAKSLEAYKRRNHRYPSDYGAFVDSKPIYAAWHSDAWDQAYEYRQADSLQYSLRSAGQDGQMGTEDDITIESPPR